MEIKVRELKPMYSVLEAAKELSVSKGTVYNLIATHTLDAVMIRSEKKITGMALAKYINSLEVCNAE